MARHVAGGALLPYKSWAFVHSNFGVIAQYPDELQEAEYQFTSALPFYVGTLYALSVFTFFGFGEEAISEYLLLWNRLQRLFGVCGFRRTQRWVSELPLSTDRQLSG